MLDARVGAASASIRERPVERGRGRELAAALVHLEDHRRIRDCVLAIDRTDDHGAVTMI